MFGLVTCDNFNKISLSPNCWSMRDTPQFSFSGEFSLEDLISHEKCIFELYTILAIANSDGIGFFDFASTKIGVNRPK